MVGRGMDGQCKIPDKLWEQIEPLLPPIPPRRKEGCSLVDSRRAMEAIFCILRAGGKWVDMEESVYECFQRWCRPGVFERMWQVGILTQDELRTLVQQIQ